MKKSFVLILALVMTLCLSTMAWGEPVANCPGNCNHVAAIGTTHYDTIQSAVDAANDGAEIDVIRSHEMDFTVTEVDADVCGTVIVNGKSVTIDLNGKTITGTFSKTVPDGHSYAPFLAHNGGTLNLKDSADGGGISLTMDKPIHSLIMSYVGGKVKIDSGSYRLNNAQSSLIYSQENETVTINGGVFLLDNIGKGPDGNGSPWIFNAKGQNVRHVIVTGGTFNADIRHQYYPFEVEAPNNRALKKNADETWTMVDAVVYVTEQEKSGNWYTNEVGYATLADAVTGAGNNVDKNKDKTQTGINPVLIKPSATPTIVENSTGATRTELIAVPVVSDMTSVQYGYSTTNDASTVAEWQDSPLFTGLSSNTEYYVFLRYPYGEGQYAISDGEKLKTAESFCAISTDGNADGTAPEQVVPIDGKITLPENTFTKEGYTFVGWSDGENTYQPGETYTMPGNADVAFTALWEEEVTTPPTPPTPPYYGGNITEDDEDTLEEEPAETKPVEKPVTPPAEEEAITPEPEDTTPVVPDAPVVDEPVVDEPPVDDEPRQGSVAVWVGIGAAAVAAGGCAIVFFRKRP